jgi:hypothetical protein
MPNGEFIHLALTTYEGHMHWTYGLACGLYRPDEDHVTAAWDLVTCLGCVEAMNFETQRKWWVHRIIALVRKGDDAHTRT